MGSWAWCLAAAAFVLAALSGWADHRRRRRVDLDRVGMIDWRTVQLAAIATVLVAVSLALHG